MGWLRQFMAQAGLRSFGEVARQALAHPEWPEDTKAQPRSLEAILGRLDRREDIDWLADRPGVQQILASLLGVSVAEIRTILLETPGLRQTVNRLRFDDLRSARSFDLPQESLPPSIPEQVGLPATWPRCCWVAKPGAGFGLVAQWLVARGLAQTKTVETRDDLLLLPRTGPPLYVEIRPELVAAFANEWEGTQPLCLAVACQTDPVPVHRQLAGFVPLVSTPIAECLDQAIDWALFRIAGRQSPQRQPLREWLRGAPLAWGLLETLGDILGLIGACLDAAVVPTDASTKDKLLRQWMAHRTDDLARERHRDTTTLRGALPELLVEMAQTVLLDDAQSFLAARTIDEWLALVPEQHRRGPDIDWLTVHLVSNNLPMRKPDLERAAQRLPPGAHRIVVALRELLILRPTSPTRFAVRPHFVGRLVQSIAKDRIASSSPHFWGEALLRPAARAELLPILLARATAQPESLADKALEHVDLENPALVGALETSFVLVGLALLGGVDVSEQLASALLQEQAALMLTDATPIPCQRTAPSEPAGLIDLEGTFLLAAWALSEHSSVRGEPLHPALDPWHAASLAADWSALLDSVATSVRAAMAAASPWLSGAIRLLDRIRQSLGAEVGANQQPHEFFLAGALLDAIELGVLEWSGVEDLFSHPSVSELLFTSARIRKITTERLTQAIFAAWSEASCPESGHPLLLRWPPELFVHVPAAAMARLLSNPESRLPPSAFACLTAASWQGWLDARSRLDLDRESELPFEYAPGSIVEQALQSRPPSLPAIRRIVWRRFAELAMRQVERGRTVTPMTAADWLRLAPAEQAPAVADYALRSDWHRASDVVTTELCRLMHRAVAERVSQWQTAYDCLNQVEAERHRFERRI
jgi:hypothetical protein